MLILKFLFKSNLLFFLNLLSCKPKNSLDLIETIFTSFKIECSKSTSFEIGYSKWCFNKSNDSI